MEVLLAIMGSQGSSEGEDISRGEDSSEEEEPCVDSSDPVGAGKKDYEIQVCWSSHPTDEAEPWPTSSSEATSATQLIIPSSPESPILLGHHKHLWKSYRT